MHFVIKYLNAVITITSKAMYNFIGGNNTLIFAIKSRRLKKSVSMVFGLYLEIIYIHIHLCVCVYACVCTYIYHKYFW